MTREELKELVNKSLGSTQLRLSERTINEELDDMLEDFGDDEAVNAKLVSKVANRLKRMDGNLHKDVSDEVKAYKEDADKKRKDGEDKKKDAEGKERDDDVLALVKKLQSDLEEERNARKQEQADRARHATLDSVRNGLKEKFESAGLKLNGFFAKSALSKLEITDEADIAELVEKAEKLYNADIKEAGISIDKPRNGGGGMGSEEKEDEHLWDDVAKLRERDNPDAERK